MKDSIERYVQRPLYYAIVDEVDSILIDEARTPLIISGEAEQSADLYMQGQPDHPAPQEGRRLHRGREGTTRRMLTEPGDREGSRQLLGIHEPLRPDSTSTTTTTSTQALRAHTLYKKRRELPGHRGRQGHHHRRPHRPPKMPGRRWSDGLHQAIEAKENVPLEEGDARRYATDDVPEPTSVCTRSCRRHDRYRRHRGRRVPQDLQARRHRRSPRNRIDATASRSVRISSTRTRRGKFRAAIAEIEECHEQAGSRCSSVPCRSRRAEVVSSLLKKPRVSPTRCLNAKFHEKRSRTSSPRPVARRAPSPSPPTWPAAVRTSSSGETPRSWRAPRSTECDPDCRTRAFARRSSPEHKEALAKCKKSTERREEDPPCEVGGIHILGTERHESRRIDNQLRGRAGRQGDPRQLRASTSRSRTTCSASSAPSVSPGSWNALGMEEDVPIEHPMGEQLAIANAQRKVEGHNFDMQKESARVRRRHEPAAQEHLRAAPRDLEGALPGHDVESLLKGKAVERRGPRTSTRRSSRRRRRPPPPRSSPSTSACRSGCSR